MLALMLALAIILLASVSVSADFECSRFDSLMGATFDFSDLIRDADAPAYIVEDGDLPCTTKKVEQNYTYYFNVCGTVSGSIPPQCSSNVGAQVAGALQVDKRGTPSDTNDDWCFDVGHFSESSTSVQTIDHTDPTKGVELTYSGDNCKDGTQRKFHIQLLCADKLNAVPTHALELSHCAYTITMPSVYGCPLECPVNNRHLCGGNGHCAFDEDKSVARCFCNHGYYGADCSSTQSGGGQNYSPALLGLIITLFIIIVALAVSLWFMVRQLSAYKEDLANYQVLKGSPDDECSAVV